jgi:hypothetical protein
MKIEKPKVHENLLTDKRITNGLCITKTEKKKVHDHIKIELKIEHGNITMKIEM